MQVKLDAGGNRRGLDVSFWFMEGVILDGVSYLSGTEAARYVQATGEVAVS